MTYPDPVYLGDGGEVSAVYRQAGGDPDLRLGPSASGWYLATGAMTARQFGLYRWDMTADPSAAGAHFHRSISESFYILEGEVRLFDGASWIDATKGDFLYVPEGGIHAFKNESGKPASMLILFAPGAPREGYFEGLVEMGRAKRPPTQEESAAFFLEHDTFWV